MATTPSSPDEETPARVRPAGPAHPLWQGVLSFPLQLESMRPWLLVAGAMIMLALIAVTFHALISILPKEITSGFAMIIYRGSWHIFTGLTLFAILFSFYPAACFLAIVQDTAAGADEVQWPSDLWFEYAWKVLHMVWLIFCSLAMAVLLMTAVVPFVDRPTWWCLTLALGTMLFPIVLLSTLVGGAPYVVLHHEVLLRLLRAPLTAVGLYLYTLVLLGSSVALGVWMVAEMVWWLVPWVGFLWGTCWLIYARVLGRVGWILDGGPARQRKKKKKKKRARTEQD